MSACERRLPLHILEVRSEGGIVNMNGRFRLILAVCVTLLVAAPAALAVTDNADQLYIGSGETYTLGGSHSYNVSVTIEGGGILYVATYDGSPNTGYLELSAPTIYTNGVINGVGRGYRRQTGPGGSSTYPGAGGGYGGAGGASGWGNPGGSPYGTSNEHDIEMGSGGGNTSSGNVGAHGGAMVTFRAVSFYNGSTIDMSGDDGAYGSMDGGGGGSGGGILIVADDITVYGNLTARGGDGGGSGGTRKGGGGGGGGRIKMFYCTIDQLGFNFVDGGSGGVAGANGSPGGTGSLIYGLYNEPAVLSIEDVGNDQGRQVRLTWSRACPDDPGAPDPVTHYTIWRRIDDVRATDDGAAQDRLYPPGSWDFVLDMPARGETEYNAVVPTLADSNASGMHWSTFFVSGVTDDPFLYYDSAPDSGYSVDNLAPAAPGAFALTRVGDTNEMVWDESLEDDFDYFTLHRGDSEGFVPGAMNLVTTLVGTDYDDDGPILSFYKLAAVDFNGNVGEYAVALPDVAGVDDTEIVALSLRVVSPAGDEVVVECALPTGGRATVGLYDVAGRLIAEREIEEEGAGRYDATLADRSGLASGVYFVKLTQGQDSDVARVVVVR